jgi:hypothetical protein
MIEGEEAVDRDNVQCITMHNRAILKWGSKGNVKTIPIDSQNVFTLRLATGYKRFLAFCTEVGYDPYQNDDEPEIMIQAQEAPLDSSPTEQGYAPSNTQEVPTSAEPTPSEGEQFDLNGDKSEKPATSTKSLEKKKENDSAELLRMHFKFGHIEFERLRQMGKVGMLPSRIADCDIPSCAACLCGKAHKRPKRTKHKRAIQPKLITKPGECVSVDVMVSATQGLIAQISGFLTRQRYKYCVVFVDHYSDFTYTHMMRTQTAVEAVQAKHAFEAFARAHDITVKHYHADNGIFAAKLWKEDCLEGKQGLTFA